MRRRTIAAAALVVVAAGATTAFVAGDPTATPARAATDRTPMRRATVATRDLVETDELDGTLGYGEPFDIAVAAQGMITALPAVGAVIDRGQVVAEVDGTPVRLLFGTRPLWRQLDAGVGSGPDVRQLEENLVALGHATTANLTVDDEWSEATTAAVKRWQKANGAEQSGVVPPAAVVVTPGPVRAADRKAAVGGPAGGGPVLSVTGTEKVVTVDLDAARRDLLPIGTAVEVELPGGIAMPASVRSVSPVVTPPKDEQSDPTVAVTIALASPAEAGFESSPVDVRVTSSKREGVLAVPIDALLALAEGGYAVERVRDARTELVAVELGASADGYVEVRGELRAGDEVVVPR